MSPSARDRLSETIENLSQNRQSHLTEEAIRAKAQYDQMKDDAMRAKKFSRSDGAIEEFNENVHILKGIFEDSQFDEIVYNLSNPGRLFIMQLLVGILRGLGFAIGVVVILFLLVYLVANSLPPGTIGSVIGIVRHVISG